MMNKTEMNYILELLRCAVTDAIPSLPPADIDWDMVYQLAVKQKITPTLYFGLQKLPPACRSTIGHFDSYVLAYKKNLILDANRNFELQELKEEFEKHNISYIFLKGSVTKHLYPDTSMRVMSDIDIYYKDADFQTINRIFSKRGYHIEKKEPKEVSFFKPINDIGIRIEMQTALIDEGYDLWFQYLGQIWDKSHSISDSNEYVMSCEDFYIYHIIHMAKHFKNGGIGLTHIMDIVMMNKAYTDLNKDSINSELKSLGLKVFENNLQLLTQYWFDNYTPTKDLKRTLELLGNYLFFGGAFGLKSQKEIIAIIERNDTKPSLLKKVFPDRRTMIDYYGNSLKKFPFLLPFYWINLNLKRIFRGKKDLKNNIERIKNISDEQIELTRELMKRCGM